ncbi:hypothetical protein DVH24_003951 [Malus domestica]|uniref:Uncharacterized protein n=1 Tax=Malus domestica TaxID=3750 RepID=A0A498K4X4_MALDO|nr:hypothetical protein DVH24_003951 [Malus domestica]
MQISITILYKPYQENKQTSILLAAKIGGIYWWYQRWHRLVNLQLYTATVALRDPLLQFVSSWSCFACFGFYISLITNVSILPSSNTKYLIKAA